MASAVALSMVLLQTRTPPNALSGSPAKAASQLSFTLARAEIPQTFVCLMIANTASTPSACGISPWEGESFLGKLFY